MSNLYQYFDVQSKEQLYEEVKSRSENVSELIDLLNEPQPYYDSKTAMNNAVLVTDLAEQLNLYADPTKKYVFNLDNRFQLQKIMPFDLAANNNQILDALLDDNGRTSSACIIAYPAKYLNNDHFKTLEELSERAELFDLRVVDALVCDDLRVVSSQGKHSFHLLPKILDKANKDYKANPERVNLNSTQVGSQLYEFKEYREFSKYYCEQEIKGLNYWDKTDKEKIDKTLRCVIHRHHFNII